MSPRFLTFFAIWQFIAEMCLWSPFYLFHSSLESTIAPIFVAGGLFGLMPGKFISMLIVEKTLWSSGLKLDQMSILEIPIEIMINLLVWVLVVKLFGLLLKKKSKV